MTLPASRAADLELALRLADAADAISLPRFGAADLQVTAKPDLTPVSDADTAVERALRDMLAGERPADRVLGEEYGGTPDGVPHRVWVLDPIDGTKNFVRGVPIWATLIALVEDGAPTVGVVSAPALARRWWASAGTGAYTTFAGGPSRRCHASAVNQLADASLSYSSLPGWRTVGRLDGFGGLLDQCWRTRAFGDFYSYMLLAEGAVDIAAEPELSVWDLAALAPIVAEAGGRMTDLAGAPIGLGSRSAVASNGPLHEAVLRATRPG